MKNITLSADEGLIRQARRRAAIEHRSLNEAFRQWMTGYVVSGTNEQTYDQLMQRLDYARAAGPFTREAMNERR
jgi:hypothetical protein